MADLFGGLMKAGGEFLASSPIGQRMGMQTERQRKREPLNQLNALAEGIQQVHEIYIMSGKTPQSKAKITGVFGKLGLPNEVLDLALSEQDTLDTKEIMKILQQSGGDVSIAIGPGGEFGGAKITHKSGNRSPSKVLTDLTKVNEEIHKTTQADGDTSLLETTKKKLETELAEAQGLEKRVTPAVTRPANWLESILPGGVRRGGEAIVEPEKTEYVPVGTPKKAEKKTTPEIATPQTAPTVTRPKQQAVITPAPAASLVPVWHKLDPRVQAVLAEKIKAQPDDKTRAEFVKKIKKDIKTRGATAVNKSVLSLMGG